MVLEVRPARAEELDAVGELTVEAYLHDGYLGAEHDYVDQLRDAAARAAAAEVYVAAAGNELLGSVTFCPAGSPFGELATSGQGEFRMLAVSPRARRRGVARALVQRCIERSRELGYTSLVLCSMPQMRAAHDLYRRLGFRRSPALDWCPEVDVSLLAFELPLP